MIAYEKWSLRNEKGLPYQRFVWFLEWITADPAWSFKKLLRRLEVNIFKPFTLFEMLKQRDGGSHG